MECVDECLQDLEETGNIVELTEEDLADFEVIDYIISIDFMDRWLVPILMSVIQMPNSWWTAVNTTRLWTWSPSTCIFYSCYKSFHRTQIHKSQSNDLFKDRYLNLLWGRLACELLLGNWEDAHSDIRQIEGYLKSNEVILHEIWHWQFNDNTIG